MKESVIQADIMKYLKGKGVYAVKVISASKSGVPDILCCANGTFVGLEVKTPNTQDDASPLQLHNLKLIQHANGESAIVWSVDQVEQIIEELL